MSEKKKDPGYCGLNPIWETGEVDSFWDACKVHDDFYNKHRKGELHQKSSKEIDLIFWRDMGVAIEKAVAAYSNKLEELGVPWLDKSIRLLSYKAYLKAKRWLYYSLVRSIGAVRWNRIRGIDVD